MPYRRFLAFDLGAESGRAVVGAFENGRLTLHELHRFPNEILTLNGRLHWNVYGLLGEIKRALKLCASSLTTEIESIAVDTWGVDFGLLAEDGTILGLPYSYRDLRTHGAMERFFKRIGREKVYKLTGIQFLPFNSLFQLFALVLDGSPLLGVARRLLFMPDLFHYLLTGEQATEHTIASTSQLLDPRTGTWSKDLFKALGLSSRMMLEPVESGTAIGSLAGTVAAETNFKEIPVVASATHDTASAIAAVPAESPAYAYISSGTWSCMGIEVSQPIINAFSLKRNFTNEGGVERTIRFLKNVMGLWLVQGCRRSWASGRTFSYEELTASASTAAPFRALIDPDAAEFMNPPDMPEAINGFLARTGQAPLESPAEFVRCILESLALKYRLIVEELREVSPHPIDRIHIIGGGAKNELLNAFTADACGLPVVAGPVEATSVGNILGQMKAIGLVRSLSEMRAVVRRSFPSQVHEPRPSAAWDGAIERFRRLMETEGESPEGRR